MNIRKKGKWKNGETKWVIEDKGKYIETLPPINGLLELLRPEIMSCEIEEKKNKKPSEEAQKFAQSLLNESQKQDIIVPLAPSKEEFEMMAKRLLVQRK